MAAYIGALARAGNHVVLRAMGRGLHAAAGGTGVPLHELALGVRDVRVSWPYLVRVFLSLVRRIGEPLLAMLAMGMASFANDLAMPPSWNSCMDIGGKYAGTVAGSMNMMGNLAGFAAPAIGGWLMDRTHGDWNLLIYLMAGIYVVGAM